MFLVRKWRSSLATNFATSKGASQTTADEANLELQEFEDRVLLRVKFSCLLGEGPRLASDAGREYQGLFEKLPAGWSLTEEGWVEPIFEHQHPASRLSSSEGDIVAVEYETGLELLLIAYALDQGTELVRWAWKEWTKRREDTRRAGGARGQDALSVEETKWAPDGTVTHRRITFSAGQVNDEVIRKYITAGT
jgi:hypothetical protein